MGIGQLPPPFFHSYGKLASYASALIFSLIIYSFKLIYISLQNDPFYTKQSFKKNSSSILVLKKGYPQLSCPQEPVENPSKLSNTDHNKKYHSFSGTWHEVEDDLFLYSDSITCILTNWKHQQQFRLITHTLMNRLFSLHCAIKTQA